MFDRKLIKEQAKTLIKRSYWILVLVVFLAGVLGATIGGTSMSAVSLNSDISDNGIIDNDVDNHYDNDWDDHHDNDWDDRYENNVPGNPWEGYVNPNNPFDFTRWWQSFANTMGLALPILIGVFVVVVLLALVFGTLFGVLVSNVVTAGVNGWLMRYWRGETPAVGDLFSTFRCYGPVVKAMFLRGLVTFLWSLLFVIPGIIKSLAYAMVPYVIYENPNLTPSQTLKISEKMTDGAKGELFVLGLSFIGWNFLSALTGGLVGIFYVNPYIGLTYAGVYDQLKWNAIQGGRLTWADFGQVAPVYDQPVAEGFGG